MEFMITMEMRINDFCECDKSIPKLQLPYILYDKIKDIIAEKRSRIDYK